MLQLEQSNAAHRLLVSTEIKELQKMLLEKLSGFHPDGAESTGEKSSAEEEEIFPTSSELFSVALNRNDIPAVRKWKEVIEHWQNGCPAKNLNTPLCQWTTHMRKGTLRSKFYDRKLIATEYFGLGEEGFIETYKPDDITIKELKRIIIAARKERESQQAGELGTVDAKVGDSDV